MFTVGMEVKTDLGIGRIIKIRHDSLGRAIYDIESVNHIFVAREEELLYHEVKDIAKQ